MDSYESWTPAILQNLVAAVLFAVGAAAVAWAKMRNWRGASPLTHGLVVWVCLHFLWHGFSTQWIGTPSFWLSLTVFLGSSVFLLYVDSWGKEQKQGEPLVVSDHKGENEEPQGRLLDISPQKAGYVAPPLVEVDANAVQWPCPSIDRALKVFDSLKRHTSQGRVKMPVKILAGPEGRVLAHTFVRMLKLFDWKVEYDSGSQSHVFPLDLKRSVDGIRVCYRPWPVDLESPGYTVYSVLLSLFFMETRMEPFPDDDEYNFIQVEIGTHPSLPQKNHL